MTVTVDLTRCDGNGECVKACAFAAIEVREGKAVVFDNCTDCGACVRACGPGALSSELFSTPGNASVLAVDFSPVSGIATDIEHAARDAEMSAVWMTVDPIDAAKASDAVGAAAKNGGYSLIALPHFGAGPSIAARVAYRLGAHLLAGCSELRIDDGGAVRAVRPRYGGIAKVQSRCGPGVTVATLLPKGVKRVSATSLDVDPTGKTAPGDAPAVPPLFARRIVTVSASVTPAADRAARGVGQALGALVIDACSATGKLSPDLYVAFGSDGSTDRNATFRNSRVVAAVVLDANAPVAQIADYLLVGDIEEHAKALLAAL
jgi:electron transfer flavoprotein alpha subunit